jgi:hypothetical protein
LDVRHIHIYIYIYIYIIKIHFTPHAARTGIQEQFLRKARGGYVRGTTETIHSAPKLGEGLTKRQQQASILKVHNSSDPLRKRMRQQLAALLDIST